VEWPTRFSPDCTAFRGRARGRQSNRDAEEQVILRHSWGRDDDHRQAIYT
jgi:hypothetical protein